jgi:hypothetical protein
MITLNQDKKKKILAKAFFKKLLKNQKIKRLLLDLQLHLFAHHKL